MKGIYVVFVFVLLCVCDTMAKEKLLKVKDKDLLRKSIIFDKNTPDVFYCPTHKPNGFDKLIVKYVSIYKQKIVFLKMYIILIALYYILYIISRSKPLHKLCEFEGKAIPKDYKPDCYQNADESDYACKEKYRIMVSML